MIKQTFYNLPEHKRQRVINAVVDEFANAESDKVSINHIVQNAEISRGSFYQYFDDKLDLGLGMKSPGRSGRKPGVPKKEAFVMRCGCPECGTYMIQSEGLDIGCVCPQCLFRCRACMGTNTVVSRENLKNLVFVDHAAEHEAQEETGTPDRAPLRPEDFID